MKSTIKKKWYRRKRFKIPAVLFGSIFLLLMAVDIYFRTRPIPECADGNETAQIQCPFLAISKPSTESRSAFMEDVQKAGMDDAMALGATMQVGVSQNGVWSTLFGKAPDIYNLENVHGISHCDRYNRYTKEVEFQLKEREIDGQVSIQDLVEIKEWIAEKENVEIISSSKQETALLFGYAGGNLETGKVFTDDIILLINNKMPARGGKMTLDLFEDTQELCEWKN